MMMQPSGPQLPMGLLNEPSEQTPQPGLVTPNDAAPPPQPPQIQGPEPTFTILVQQVPRVGRIKVYPVPPEEFRVSRRARTVSEADYHGWRYQAYQSDIILEYPDETYDLDPSAVTGRDLDTTLDERVQSRFPNEYSQGAKEGVFDEQRKKVWVHIEYIRVDYDGDGIVELRRIKRVGHVILENHAVDNSEFVAWTPIRVAHRLIGRSLADTLLDIQKIRTVITRRAMDSLTQTLTPTRFINSKALANDPSLLDRMLDNEVGDVIPVDGDPNTIIRDIVSPDVTASAFQAIEYWDRRSEEASGVNRHAMGIQPQAITETKGGIENLQAAANIRIEQVARWLAMGLREVFQRMLVLIMERQDHARIIKINGRKMTCDPRRWSDEMTVDVHVGMVGESREKRLQYLSAIASKQEAIMAQAGFGNPLVGPVEYSHTLRQMVAAMGFRNTAQFIKELPADWQPPAPSEKPDPKMIEAQGRQQIAQAEFAAKQQMMQAEMVAKQQMAQEQLQIKAQQAARDAEIKQAMAAQDAQVRQAIEAAKIDSIRNAQAAKADLDRQIAEVRAKAEADLAVMRLNGEMELARYKIEMAARYGASNMNGSGEMHIKKDRPGGSLDA